MAIEMPEPVISVQLVIDAAMINAMAGLTPEMLANRSPLKATVDLIQRVMERHEARIPVPAVPGLTPPREP